MAVNWQKVHEDRMDDMRIIAGRPVKQLERDIAHLDERSKNEIRLINELNTTAVHNYYEEAQHG